MSVIPYADLTHDIPVLGPIGVGVATLGTVWTQIIGSDLTRRGIIFHNPGAHNLFVCPTNITVQPSSNQGALLIQPQSEVEILAENEYNNVNSAWMGWVDAGTNQPVSILNFSGTNASVPPPEPLAQLRQGSAISSPLGSGVLLGVSVSAAISSNAQRRGIIFHNPGTIPLAVMPANLSVTYGVAGSIILLPGDTKTFMAKPNSRIRVNCGWSACAQSSSNNPLTIMEILG